MKQTTALYEQHVLDGADVISNIVNDISELDPDTPEGASEIDAALKIADLTAQAMIALSNLAIAAAIEKSSEVYKLNVRR